MDALNSFRMQTITVDVLKQEAGYYSLAIVLRRVASWWDSERLRKHDVEMASGRTGIEFLNADEIATAKQCHKWLARMRTLTNVEKFTCGRVVIAAGRLQELMLERGHARPIIPLGEPEVSSSSWLDEFVGFHAVDQILSIPQAIVDQFASLVAMIVSAFQLVDRIEDIGYLEQSFSMRDEDIAGELPYRLLLLKKYGSTTWKEIGDSLGITEKLMTFVTALSRGMPKQPATN